MSATDTPTWLDYGPAEFDARRASQAARKRDQAQAALFFAAVPPLPVKPVSLPVELPGQGDLFADGGKS